MLPSLPRLALAPLFALTSACGTASRSSAGTATELRLARPAPSVRFSVIGDFGAVSPSAERVAALVTGWDPELVITLGDNNYPNGRAATLDDNVGQYYHAFIHPYRGHYGEGAAFNRFFPSLGNHDWRPPGPWPFLDYFQLPGNERYYEFVWGPVHFFAVDSDLHEPDGSTPDSDQARWLEARLRASTSPWQVVYMHHPAYSSGDHGSTPRMRWPYAEWGADVVLAGHDHHYERIEWDDITYVVNGLGGYPQRYGLRRPVAGSQVRYNEDHGAMLVEATEHRLELRFVTIAGQEIDRHVIEHPRPESVSAEPAAPAPTTPAPTPPAPTTPAPTTAAPNSPAPNIPPPNSPASNSPAPATPAPATPAPVDPGA